MSLQMEIKWNAKIQPRRGIQLSTFTQNNKILVHHADGSGVSLVNALSGQEEWSTRVKNACLSHNFRENENSYLIRGLDHWFRFDKNSGEYDQAAGVHGYEDFIAQCNNIALFSNLDKKKYYSCIGSTIFDGNSQKVIRDKKDGVLCPYIGYGFNFFGQVKKEGIATYYTGILSTLESFASRIGWNIVTIPKLNGGAYVIKTGNGASGFSVHSGKDLDFLFFYDWSGELRFSVPIPAHLANDLDITSTVPWGLGGNGILLIGNLRKSLESIVLIVDNINNPTISRIVTTKGRGPLEDFGVCSNWLVWLDVMVPGGPILAANLLDGKVEMLREGNTNCYLLCNDDGVFFGDSTKGIGHLSRGTFLPE